ncbi:MAG: DUF6350 family protein [Propionibacteriaceae bacterium]|nr:DUF6350 family protein [Propionibacteriaceae bacterium]
MAVHLVTAMEAHAPWLPWQLVSFLAGMGVAVVSWLICTGVSVVAWFGATDSSFTATIDAGTQFWLLSLGVPAVFDGAVLSLPPLGLTLLQFFLCALAGQACFRMSLGRKAQRLLSSGPIPSAYEVKRWERLQLLGQLVVFVAAGYLAVVLITLLIQGRAGSALVGGLSAVGIAVFGTAFGSRRDWADAILTPLGRRAAAAVGVGVLALTAIGALVLLLAVGSGWDRIEALEGPLGIDLFGAVAWGLALIAWLPNLLVNACSFALGAGFSIGPDSSVTIAATQLGMLPSVPVFGALPANGLWPEWMGILLVTGVLVGVLVGFVAVPKFLDVPTLRGVLVSALSGLLTAGVLLAFAWFATGGLGSERLAGIGPRMVDLALIAPITITAGALLATLVREFIWGSAKPEPDETHLLPPAQEQ